RDGGTHEQGLRSAIIDAVRACVFDGQRCSSDALLEGVVAAVHVLHLSPEFGNPTKDRLQSPECETLVRETTGPALIAWLRDHPTSLPWLSARQRCDGPASSLRSPGPSRAQPTHRQSIGGQNRHPSVHRHTHSHLHPHDWVPAHAPLGELPVPRMLCAPPL